MPIRFGLVGGGWRAEFFTRIARELPDRFRFAGVWQRDHAKAQAFGARWQAPAFETLEQLADAGLDFVVVSVKPEAHPALLRQLHGLGQAVLCETPAALDLPAMREIWTLVEDGMQLHVAEQYLFQPLHATRLKLINGGALGPVNHARVSVAHGYHGVSLMRHYLGIGFEPATIRGKRFATRGLEGPTRFGWPGAERLARTDMLLGEFDFGDRLGLFEFSDGQYRSPVHSMHVLVRGERGEISDFEVRVMPDYGQPLVQAITRADSGRYSDLYGYAIKTMSVGDKVLWTNPYPGARLMDDEIAIAVAMERMMTEAGPYSFAEAAQDQYLSLLMAQAADSGETLRSERQPWAG